MRCGGGGGGRHAGDDDGGYVLDRRLLFDEDEVADNRGRLDFGEDVFFLVELLSDIVEQGSISSLSPSWA